MRFGVNNILDEVGARTIIETIRNNPNESEYIIDLKNLTDTKPLGVAILANELTYFKRNSKHISFAGIDTNPYPVTYLQAAGFFDVLGIQRENIRSPKEHNIQVKLMNITRGYLHEIMDNSPRMVLQEAIEDVSEAMTYKIFNKPNSHIAYCFREIIRNVFEHSGADSCTCFAQHKRASGTLEIAVADSGAGILSAISKKNKFITTTDEAIEFAIKPGASGADTSGTDEYSNSGFGLYVMSKIGEHFGKFTIATNDRIHYMGSTPTKKRPYHYHGTAVGLFVNYADFINNGNVVERIVHDGERLAKTLGLNSKASTKSKIIGNRKSPK